MKHLLCLALLFSPAIAPIVAQTAPATERIHPYTQQLTDQWLAQLDKAEAVSKPGGDPNAAKPVLEALETFFSEKKQTLERHPDYKKPLLRQVLLRIKLAKITAVSGLGIADAGLAKKDPNFFTGKGGAYEVLGEADALVEAIASVTGKEQDAYTGVAAFVAQIRGKVDEKASQIKIGGVGTVVAGGAKLHPFTKQTFETWLKNMESDRGVMAGAQPLDTKLKELENGRSWFQSNRQELQKHPNFSQAIGQMTALDIDLAGLKAQRAVGFAQAGLKEMNPNAFHDSSGTYQKLKEAEQLCDECAKTKGAGDPACAQLSKTIAGAKAEIEAIKLQYRSAAAEKYRLPPEKYTGGDKSDLKKSLLAKWKELYPADKVLGVRFHRADWERKKESTLNNGTWYHYDNSVLVAYVVVKTSPELATVYPGYFTKNNQSGSITVGVETKGNGFVQDDMLLKNVDL